MEGLNVCAKTMQNNLFMPKFDTNLRTELIHQTCIATRSYFGNLAKGVPIVYRNHSHSLEVEKKASNASKWKKETFKFKVVIFMTVPGIAPNLITPSVPF